MDNEARTIPSKPRVEPWNKGKLIGQKPLLIRTLPVKYSAGLLVEGREPLCLISIALDLSVTVSLRR